MTQADLELLKDHVDQIYIHVTTNQSMTEIQMKWLRNYVIELHKMVRCIVPHGYIDDSEFYVPKRVVNEMSKSSDGLPSRE